MVITSSFNGLPNTIPTHLCFLGMINNDEDDDYGDEDYDSANGKMKYDDNDASGGDDDDDHNDNDASGDNDDSNVEDEDVVFDL